MWTWSENQHFRKGDEIEKVEEFNTNIESQVFKVAEHDFDCISTGTWLETQFLGGVVAKLEKSKNATQLSIVGVGF